MSALIRKSRQISTWWLTVLINVDKLQARSSDERLNGGRRYRLIRAGISVSVPI